jgi:hypothetical protein
MDALNFGYLNYERLDEGAGEQKEKELSAFSAGKLPGP